MKKIFSIMLVMTILLLTGCWDKKTPEESGEDNIGDDTTVVAFERSELYGTWKSDNAAPLIINKDGSAESVVAEAFGTYSVSGNELTIVWPENDRTETYRIEKSDGELSLVYGEEPLLFVYHKE